MVGTSPVVLPATEFLDERTRVLKYGDSFAVLNTMGDACPKQGGAHGYFHEGTRYISRFEMRICEEIPVLLGSTVTEDNAELSVDLTNQAVREGERVMLPADSIHILKRVFLYENSCYQKISLFNHGVEKIHFSISFLFDSDFADIFEVRGFFRKERGQKQPVLHEDNTIRLAYLGLDGKTRESSILFDVAPYHVAEHRFRYEFSLGPKSTQSIDLMMIFQADAAQAKPADVGTSIPTTSTHRSFERASEANRARLRQRKEMGCQLTTSNEVFNVWLNRSISDLYLLLTDVDGGAYPYAGIPWYNTVFGRDGIITALETLWLDPSISRGVLRCLSKTQAEHEDTERDEEPGKIVHETRLGEMAVLHEVPFGLYYGSVDSTPLFITLVHEYHKRTHDDDFVASLWPNVLRAIRWMEVYGDVDGDLFLEYSRSSPTGLVQQGWKDSDDSVFHADGTLAEGPIALCEVQGYAYAAYRAAAQLADWLGTPAEQKEYLSRAAELKKRFAERFWSDEIASFVLALDGKKRPCEVRTSNAGHTLWTGIAEAEQASSTARVLMGPSMFSGWGIRTVSAQEIRYNPISYHNGSVWPHDNAIVAAGLSKYGFKSAVNQTFSALFDVSLFVDLHRMPELFCGFSRRAGQGPTAYPTACAPQAWSAAAVFMLLEAALGLSVDAVRHQIRFDQPILPPWLDWVEIRNLRIGANSIDLLLRRARHDVGIEVLRKTGDKSIAVTKSV